MMATDVEALQMDVMSVSAMVLSFVAHRLKQDVFSCCQEFSKELATSKSRLVCLPTIIKEGVDAPSFLNNCHSGYR